MPAIGVIGRDFRENRAQRLSGGTPARRYRRDEHFRIQLTTELPAIQAV